jgi:hypothetical protein
MIEPKIQPAIEVSGARTVATEVASIDLRLGEMIRQVAEANGYDSIETINVLERSGLPTALEFVQPLLEILKRGTDSPLRRLSSFEMSCLYVDNARRQIVILDELEAQLKEGRAVVFQTGMIKTLWASYRGKIQAAKHREGVRMNRTRDDYQKEVVELRDRISLYEHALEKVAAEVGLEVNEFVSQLIGN